MTIKTPKIAKQATQQATTRTQPVRQAITFELVAALAPHAPLAANLSRTFALEEVDYAGIREAHEEAIVRAAQTLAETLNEKALEIHLQRIAGSFVGSAHGAAVFYGNKATAAVDLTSKLANDDRDEDRSGVYGFDSKAQNARQFAAQVGLQAYALLAAADGALAAYEHLTGETWKPYVGNAPAGDSVSRQSAAAEIAAFTR